MKEIKESTRMEFIQSLVEFRIDEYTQQPQHNSSIEFLTKLREELTSRYNKLYDDGKTLFNV